jgi:hypothetical protein
MFSFMVAALALLLALLGCAMLASPRTAPGEAHRSRAATPFDGWGRAS